jgi:hypothetical protein
MEETLCYYILTGMHPERWYKLAAELSHLGLEARLFGFSNKEPHVYMTEELANKLRTEYHLKVDGPYGRAN